MQKQEKKLNFKRVLKNKYNKKLKTGKFLKRKSFLNSKGFKRILKFTQFSRDPLNLYILNKIKDKFSKKINIRVTANNIFCTLVDLKSNKTLIVGSGGKYKVKTSKKKLSYNIKIVLDLFFKDILEKLLPKEELLLNLISPLKIRKKIIRQLFTFLKKKRNLTINIVPKKAFNGCRPPKKIRKRKKGLRIFK